MLKHIDYSLEFSNGAKRNLTADLQDGSTMITGRNGRGKSLLLEMFSFALFGAKALRGVAGDYKKIDVTVRVMIRGKDYEIKRTKSKAQISYNGDADPLATTTTPVNQFIEQLLGYNYDVFRVSNWCAQGDIQALANMKPTERKAMIDNVAGLTQLDGLIDSVKAEIKTLKATVNAVEAAVIKPVAPDAPEVNEDDVRKVLGKAVELETEKSQLLGQLLQFKFLTEPPAPAPLQLHRIPESPPLPEPLPAEPKLDPLPRLTVTDPIKPTIMGDKTYREMVDICGDIYDDMILHINNVKTAEGKVSKAVAVPEHARAFMASTTEQFVVQQNEYWQQKKSYESLLAQGDVTCPNCQHKHPLASDALAKFDTSLFPAEAPLSIRAFEHYRESLALEAQLEQHRAALLAKYGTKADIEAGFNRLTEIKAELVAYQDACGEFSRLKTKHEYEVDTVERLNAQRIATWKNDCKRVEHSNASLQSAFLAHCDDLAYQNKQLQGQFDKLEAQYIQAKSDYENNLKVKAKVEKDLAKVTTKAETMKTTEVIPQCEQQLAQWGMYKALYANYERQLDDYNSAIGKVADDKVRLEDLQKSQTALVELKSRVKTYIIPSLNKVASYLLSEMTGGEHAQIAIDEDFEVYVDGQPLRTMSGSGKDIANLSIRIALGRILTHKVLGMMMLDEIDQGMDESRAAYTWECLEKITPQIGQVLQVSHKELRAENRLVIQ